MGYHFHLLNWQRLKENKLYSLILEGMEADILMFC